MMIRLLLPSLLIGLIGIVQGTTLNEGTIYGHRCFYGGNVRAGLKDMKMSTSSANEFISKAASTRDQLVILLDLCYGEEHRRKIRDEPCIDLITLQKQYNRLLLSMYQDEDDELERRIRVARSYLNFAENSAQMCQRVTARCAKQIYQTDNLDGVSLQGHKKILCVLVGNANKWIKRLDRFVVKEKHFLQLYRSAYSCIASVLASELSGVLVELSTKLLFLKTERALLLRYEFIVQVYIEKLR